MRVRKYLKGAVISSFDELAALIFTGCYVFMLDRPQHPGWVAGMQFNVIRGFIENKRLRRAEINPEWREQVTP